MIEIKIHHLHEIRFLDIPGGHRTEQKVDALIHAFNQLNTRFNEMATANQLNFDEINAAIAEETEVDQSVMALLDHLPDIVAAAVAKALGEAGVNQADAQATINKAAQDIRNNVAQLKASVVKNTPSEGTVPDPTPTPDPTTPDPTVPTDPTDPSQPVETDPANPSFRSRR